MWLKQPDYRDLVIENRTCAWADFDGDGLIDVFITQIDGLYKNNGDGTFTDVTDAAGIIHNSDDVQAGAWGDYDNDGYPDLYVTLGVETGERRMAAARLARKFRMRNFRISCTTTMEMALLLM